MYMYVCFPFNLEFLVYVHVYTTCIYIYICITSAISQEDDV